MTYRVGEKGPERFVPERKGDSPGHPFRGNQYTAGGGGLHDAASRYGVTQSGTDVAKLKEQLKAAPLHELASTIEKDWGSKVNYAARPYLSAMHSLSSISDKYGMDSGRSVVAYFLSNASSWKGPVAQAVKSELRSRLQAAYGSRDTLCPDCGMPAIELSRPIWRGKSGCAIHGPFEVKGDSPGHPFRGNQWTDGSGGALSSRDAALADHMVGAHGFSHAEVAEMAAVPHALENQHDWRHDIDNYTHGRHGETLHNYADVSPTATLNIPSRSNIVPPIPNATREDVETPARPIPNATRSDAETPATLLHDHLIADHGVYRSEITPNGVNPHAQVAFGGPHTLEDLHSYLHSHGRRSVSSYGVKGDSPGHPFRGNQFTSGQGLVEHLVNDHGRSRSEVEGMHRGAAPGAHGMASFHRHVHNNEAQAALYRTSPPPAPRPLREGRPQVPPPPPSPEVQARQRDVEATVSGAQMNEGDYRVAHHVDPEGGHYSTVTGPRGNWSDDDLSATRWDVGNALKQKFGSDVTRGDDGGWEIRHDGNKSARFEALVAKKMAEARGIKGDVPGHEFHGNQYTSNNVATVPREVSNDEARAQDPALERYSLMHPTGADIRIRNAQVMPGGTVEGHAVSQNTGQIYRFRTSGSVIPVRGRNSNTVAIHAVPGEDAGDKAGTLRFDFGKTDDHGHSIGFRGRMNADVLKLAKPPGGPLISKFEAIVAKKMAEAKQKHTHAKKGGGSETHSHSNVTDGHSHAGLLPWVAAKPGQGDESEAGSEGPN